MTIVQRGVEAILHRNQFRGSDRAIFGLQLRKGTRDRLHEILHPHRTFGRIDGIGGDADALGPGDSHVAFEIGWNLYDGIYRPLFQMFHGKLEIGGRHRKREILRSPDMRSDAA